MSWVCNVLLSVDIQDREALDAFNGWLCSKGVGMLGDLAGQDAPAWDGPKYPECRLWGGAFNHVDVGATVSKFAEHP